MSDPVLSVEHLDVGYDDRVVVSDFSLTVRAGEFVSLLGPSGCGKTTVLRALAGFLPVRHGRIVLGGAEITRDPPERRDIGIVFQNYALFPTMTAFENIAFGLRVARLPHAEVEARVQQIADTAAISDCLQHKPAMLSGGQQQRVATARALVLRPRVLLFDEPFSNLDAKVRVAMRREIKRLQRELGFTALFVTHDQDEALSLSDTIVVMREGTIEQVGDGRTLYRTPASPFICRFVGAANELPPALVERLLGRPANGRTLVRHEDVILTKSDGAAMDAAMLEAEVVDVEFLGAQSRVDCDLAGHRITAVRHGGELPQIGERVGIHIRPGAAHVFAE